MTIKRLFVDMDGTLAEFKKVDTLETLYEQGYFLNLSPQMNVVEAVKHIVRNHPEIEVNILSSVLTDSKFAFDEKNRWLDQYLPEIGMEHRIFPPCGESKKDYIAGGTLETDFLLDDYSTNLIEWEPPAKGIKLMNGINGTKGTWKSDSISYEISGIDIAEKIVRIMEVRERTMSSTWTVESAALTHDGYATATLSVKELNNGVLDEYETTAYFRIFDPVNGQEMKLVSIDENLALHPILIDQWDKIENAVKEKVIEAEVLEGFMDIVYQAKHDMLRMKSPWGAWFGRVVNEERPEEYLDIMITGVERTSEYLVDLKFVNGLWVDDSMQISTQFDVLNENSIDNAVAQIVKEGKSFLYENVKHFQMQQDRGVQLYSPYTETTLEQHYEKLENNGFQKFPENDNSKKNNFEQSNTQENIISFSHRRGR